MVAERGINPLASGAPGAPACTSGAIAREFRAIAMRNTAGVFIRSVGLDSGGRARFFRPWPANRARQATRVFADRNATYLETTLELLSCRECTNTHTKSVRECQSKRASRPLDLAVEHATPEQIHRLAAAADEFAKVAAVSGHSVEADKLDIAFHAIILEMTGNPLVAGMH